MKKYILGRRYDFSLKHICNMTRRHDTRHHDFMQYIDEAISTLVMPCLRRKIPLRRFTRAETQFCIVALITYLQLGLTHEGIFSEHGIYRKGKREILIPKLSLRSCFVQVEPHIVILNQQQTIFMIAIVSLEDLSDCVKFSFQMIIM